MSTALVGRPRAEVHDIVDRLRPCLTVLVRSSFFSDRRLWCRNSLGRWHLAGSKAGGHIELANKKPTPDSHPRVATPGAPLELPTRGAQRQSGSVLRDVQAFGRTSSRGPGGKVAVSTASSDRTRAPPFATASLGPAATPWLLRPSSRSSCTLRVGAAAKGARRPC
jgi:hypothetical protein